MANLSVLDAEKEVLFINIEETLPPIQNWNAWLVKFTRATTSNERESLVHISFTVSLETMHYDEKRYSEIDRITTLLAIADGWTESVVRKEKEPEYVVGQYDSGRSIRKTATQLRKELACKAFGRLALNFFNLQLRDKDEFHFHWERIVVSERLFLVIQEFFKPEKEQFGNDMVIRNLSRSREPSHNEKQARDFLLNLAQFLWKWREPDTSYYSTTDREKINLRLAETRSRIENAKPWMVEVLANLHRLDILEEFILQLDEPCLAKLRGIALCAKLSQYRHPVSEDRVVDTLSEACYAGSKAAWFLKRHELMTTVNNQLVTIRDAELRTVEVMRELEALRKK